MFDIKKTINPTTLEEALDALAANEGAKLVAGGTDVMVALRDHKLSEAVLINIREIDELHEIKLLENGDLFIGACAEFDRIYESDLVRDRVPFLAEACNTVGSPQIRHIATIGGNICNASVAADSATSLLVLDAVLRLRSAGGERELPITQFFAGPGRTVLGPDEMVTAIIIRKNSYEKFAGSYIKLGQRNALELATISVACAVALSEDKKHVEEMHMAFGVAAPTPKRLLALEEKVKGAEINENLFELVSREASLELSPIDHINASREYKLQLIRVLGVRALKEAIVRAGGEADV